MLLFGESYLDALDDNLNEQLNENNNFSISKININSKIPKLRIHRLSEEKQFVPIEVYKMNINNPQQINFKLDIQINERLIIQQRFFWNLNDQHISPSEFITKFCQTLNLNESIKEKMISQMMFQLVDYIVNNTYLSRAKQKQIDQQKKNEFDEEFQISKVQTAFNNHSITPDQIDIIQDKKTARQKKIEEQKQLSTNTINHHQKSNYFKDKKSCLNCGFKNIVPTINCQKCKIPYYLSDQLQKDDPRIKLSLQFFQKILKKFPSILEELNNFQIPLEWFESTYNLQKNLCMYLNQLQQTEQIQMNEICNIINEYFNLLLKNEEIPENQEQMIDEQQEYQDKDENISNNTQIQQSEAQSEDISNNNINNVSANKQSKSQVIQSSQSQGETNQQHNSQTSQSDNQSGQRSVNIVQKQIQKRGRPPQKSQRGRKQIQ